ncbi:alpha/beta hydrolase family protein [Microcella alkaliphila]|uniref:Alpha/beta hydrolase family protein n=2 Tax=Microcella alkaliphila TaxID=279828 RepID=A0A4V6MBV2_9MICO|nr:alpha/beta hydrolase [Microcella alkaliphila]RZT62359.1 alpha/beta hydrolase family protein [Microcella alkaliphila]
MLDADSGTFLDIDPLRPVEEQTALFAEALSRTPDATVVAHSWGGTLVGIAMAHDVARPTALVLVEPAMFDLARTNESVSHHIDVMTDARTLADAGDLRGFWNLVKPMMFGAQATDDDWKEDEPHAARFAQLTLPWGFDLDEALPGLPPTLVITGAWWDGYEAIAQSLVGRGAQHIQLQGAGHRPQDLPGFSRVLNDWKAR